MVFTAVCDHVKLSHNLQPSNVYSSLFGRMLFILYKIKPKPVRKKIYPHELNNFSAAIWKLHKNVLGFLISDIYYFPIKISEEKFYYQFEHLSVDILI